MDDPDLPPDLLSAFLVPPPPPPRSAPSTIPPPHSSPDPHPPSADLHPEGSLDGKKSEPVAGEPVQASQRHMAEILQIDADELGPRGLGQSRPLPSPRPATEAQKHSTPGEDGSMAHCSDCGATGPASAIVSAQKHSIPPGRTDGRPSPSSQPRKAGAAADTQEVRWVFNGTPALGNHEHQSSMPGVGEVPGSPTRIDPEIQAQASTLLLELAREVNKSSINGKDTTSERGRNNTTLLLKGSPRNPSETPGDPQEEREIQCAILQSRFSVSLKGKGKMENEGIHEDQTTHSLHRSTPHRTMMASCSHNTNVEDTEEGWEIAKFNRRKRNGSEETVNPHREPSKEIGTLYFKSRMAGRCFNCFSPNHIAPACHRATRCWKCYLSGHQARDCASTSNSKHHKAKLSYKEDHHRPVYSHSHSPSSNEHKRDQRSLAEVIRGGRSATEVQGGMAVARYPGDPHARPARAFCAVTATGEVRRRRDEIINRAAVCWLPGSSHDTEPRHLGDALRRLDIYHDDVQILKHYPEQFLCIFNNPRDRQRVLDVGVLPDNGCHFQFA